VSHLAAEGGERQGGQQLLSQYVRVQIDISELFVDIFKTRVNFCFKTNNFCFNTGNFARNKTNNHALDTFDNRIMLLLHEGLNGFIPHGKHFSFQL
jgi:hypothetical protein